MKTFLQPLRETLIVVAGLLFIYWVAKGLFDLLDWLEGYWLWG